VHEKGLFGKTMTDQNPRIRTDLEFFPIRNGDQNLLLVRDHLGLVQEGKAVPPQIYRFMTLLDGTKTARDIQMLLIRERGGILVGIDEVERILTSLDEAFLLDGERYRQAREQIVTRFSAQTVRPCAHAGRSFPAQAEDLRKRLDEILSNHPAVSPPEGKGIALIAPHIDLSVGYKVYASAYQWLTHFTPSRVVVLGVGHQMSDLFSLTDKDFETPLGMVKNDRAVVHRLQEAGQSVIYGNEFAHKSEHSVEFQVIFLQHLFKENPFSLVPVLCGPLRPCLPEYTRNAYVETTGPFLKALSEVLLEENQETLLVAGVDFSHIGPKFGHRDSSTYIQDRAKAHDQNLLHALSEADADAFWQESARESDQYNVCGFSAMACLMEVLPPFRGQVLNYQMWHEQPTRSAVSFAAVGFTSLA
jgi:AmmeMemoRadiSam system protein B